MSHLDRLKLPICFIHGAENQCFLPVSTELTYNALREANGKGLYSRHVIPSYGHIDCIYGKDAARDVYPYILEHLEATLE
jgi:cholesterol oxidase